MPDSKKDDRVRALILGDVIGKPGCRALFSHLKTIIRKHKADIVIVNGENADDGSGILPSIVNDFFSAGVDVITSGNHIWRKKEIYPVLDSEARLLRPENYPKGTPGKGFCTVEIKGHKVSVLNLEGELNRSRLRCPFKVGKECAQKLRQNGAIVIVDFHAELAGEKEALAHYLDGHVSLIFGTHTHVQTADEKILPKGTGYITDIGMTGPSDSVIGVIPEIAVRRMCTQMPLKMEVCEKPAVIMGIVADIDSHTGTTTAISRLHEKCLI